MGKFSFILANALGLLLMGCHDNSKAQAEQLAIMQARLGEQEHQNHLLQAQAKEKEEQRMREEELRKADERAWAEQNAHKTANTKTKQPNQPETPTNSPKSA